MGLVGQVPEGNFLQKSFDTYSKLLLWCKLLIQFPSSARVKICLTEPLKCKSTIYCTCRKIVEKLHINNVLHKSVLDHCVPILSDFDSREAGNV